MKGPLMLNLLRALTRNLIIVIPVSMAAGLLFGVISDPAPLKVFIPAFTFIMVFPMMVTLQYKKAFTKFSWLPQGIAQFTNFIILPLLGYGLGRIFFPDRPFLALGLLLAALIPTSGMTVSWTGFAKGNVEEAVKMMIFGLITGSVLAPFYIRFLLGAQVDVNVAIVLRKVFLIVLLPMAVGFVTRQILLKLYGQKEFSERIGPAFPPLSTLGVIGMVFTAIALRAQVIVDRPLLLLEILIPVLLFYGLTLTIGIWAGRLFLPRADAIALIYGTSLRNLSISLAIAVNAFGKAGTDAALVLAAAFIVQTQVATWSTKFVDRLFGLPEG
ncbi:bile acid:sodium symporter [bacterium]|nr:bile acid:sodium symporter [bacterium]